ncbi:MAG: hypothetical protein KAT77_01045 [Nanoarchaeota archaeon]|nr:hypothetical protein [Nanoarchaeota archaeon]
MQHKTTVVITVFIVLVILFIVFTRIGGEEVIEAECSVDADCVAATCCHASEAVPLSQAPDCADIFCTTECVPGTLDCGQGEIKCLDGKCEAIIY